MKKVHKAALTFGEYYGFFSLGLILALLGPTLLDLAHQVGGDIKQLSYVFTARSVGYLLGGIVGGVVFDRTHYTVLLLGSTMLLTSVSALLVSYAHTVVVLGCVVSLQGFAMGFFDTGGNVLLLRLYGKQCGPWLQGLHAFFGLGAFTAPLIAKHYIGQDLPSAVSDCPITAGAGNMTTTTAVATTMGLTTTAAAASFGVSHIKTAYRLVSAIIAPTAVLLIILSFYTPRDFMSLKSNRSGGTVSNDSGHGHGHGAGESNNTASRKYIYGLLGLAFFFFMLYVGTEVCYGAFLFSYTVKNCGLQFSEHDGALATSVYWGLFTVGRFLAIPLSVKFSPRTLIVADLVGCFLAATLLAAYPNNPGVVWGASGLFGLSMASVFPSGYHTIENYMEITTAHTSVLIVGSALGEMLMPLIVGTLFATVGPASFPKANLAFIITATLVFMLIAAWIRYHTRGGGRHSARSGTQYTVVGVDAIMMHELSAFGADESSDEDDVVDVVDDDLVFDIAAGEIKRRLVTS